MKQPTYFLLKTIHFSLFLVFFSLLYSCSSYQYYAENPDGIYPQSKHQHSSDNIKDPYRTFSNGIAGIENELYFEDTEYIEQENQQNRVEGDTQVTVYLLSLIHI